MEFQLLVFLLVLRFGASVNPLNARIFNVIRFPNDLCLAQPYNGTCYTSEECEQRGGSPNGECAFGYGVCCVFTLDCGGTTSDNSTYLVKQKSSFLSHERSCSYSICKMSKKICRIKFEFRSFVISDPVMGTTIEAVTATGVSSGPSIGDCLGDTFSLSSSGNAGSPIICGYNSGQHMFIDAQDACVRANFIFNTADKSTKRNYNIRVLQYICGDDMGGPPDCLQYFAHSSGTVKSFNFPETLTASTTHLSAQDYHICFRRASGKCALCMVPSTTITGTNSPTSQSSFGLSVSPSGTIANSATELSCSTDFIAFPGGQTSAIASIAGTVANGLDRICGRVWTTNSGASGVSAIRSVCSSRRPFMMYFRTDHDEAENDGDAASQTASNNEQELAPGGIIGFSFDFRQVDCS